MNSTGEDSPVPESLLVALRTMPVLQVLRSGDSALAAAVEDVLVDMTRPAEQFAAFAQTPRAI